MSLPVMSDFAQSLVWKLDSSSAGAFPAAALILGAAVLAFVAATLEEAFLPMVARKGAVREGFGGFEIGRLRREVLARG